MATPHFDQNLGYLVGDIARLLRVNFERRAKKHGLSRAQWWILAHLYRQDGQRQTDLAAELEMSPAPLGRLLDKLEKNGWIKRCADEVDRRAKRVYRTKKIDPYLETLRTEAAELYEEAFSGLSKREQEKLLSQLRRMRSNILVED